MPDFRVADTAPSHRKMRAAGLAAIGLWAMAGAQSMASMEDGWVPDWFVKSWGPNGSRLARQLCDVGLWQRASRDNKPGFTFHDWEEYQRLAADIESARQKARERMTFARTHRERAADVRANTARTSEETPGEREREPPPNVPENMQRTYAEPSPNPSPSPSPHGGTSRGDRPVGERADARNEPPGNDHGNDHKPQGRPADRCRRHVNTAGDPGPCRACGDARRAAENWDRRSVLDDAMTARRCRLCDADGWRYEPGTRIPLTPYVRCDHAPIRKETRDA